MSPQPASFQRRLQHDPSTPLVHSTAAAQFSALPSPHATTRLTFDHRHLGSPSLRSEPPLANCQFQSHYLLRLSILCPPSDSDNRPPRRSGGLPAVCHPRTPGLATASR